MPMPRSSDRLRLKSSGLDAPQFPIESPALLQKLPMSSFRGDHAILDHDNAVHLHDRRKPMRDHDDRLSLHKGLERVLNERFRLRIQTGGCFIKHEDRRIFQDRARDRDPLTFAAGKFHAAFTDKRRIPFGKRGNELVTMRRAAASITSSSLASRRP